MDTDRSDVKVRRPRRIRTQLLLAVNIPFSLAILFLLGWDYQRELQKSVEAKQDNLVDESVAIHRAVLHLLSENDEAGVQFYVDSVCQAMCDRGATDHSVAVAARGRTFVTRGGGVDVARQIAVLQMESESPSPEIRTDDKLVVGSYSASGITVLVTESTMMAQRSIQKSVFYRLIALASVGFAAIGIANVILLRTVERPIRRLVNFVDRIRNGHFETIDSLFAARETVKLSRALCVLSSTLSEEEEKRTAQSEKTRQIQEHLLPTQRQIPGLDFCALFEPADNVAGDYYDVIPLSDGSWLIVLADVVGHGVPAALEAAMLKILLGHAVEQTGELSEILDIVNTGFLNSTPEGDFASVFLLRWQPDKLKIQYANAGHIPGLLRRTDGRVVQLRATGLLIGVSETAEWESRSISVDADERLILVSDGATECRSTQEGLYGLNRLSRFIGDSHGKCSALTISHLRNDLAEFGDEHRVDDVTAIAIIFGRQESFASTVAAGS